MPEAIEEILNHQKVIFVEIEKKLELDNPSLRDFFPYQ